MKRQALGKGLDALLPQVSPPPDTDSVLQLELNQLKPNGFQPRVHFESGSLDELAASIAENGILQPIVVRRADSGYEIIAGERRWRAARKAGLETIPAIIQEVSDEKMLELALVENIQRDELSPIEEAHAYKLLTADFALTQEQVAQRVGRSRASVANTLRLLKLPRSVQELVNSSRISMGHARALLPLARKDQLQLARLIVRRDLSVRAVEKRVKQLQLPPKAPPEKDPNLHAAETKLEEKWKTRVALDCRNGRGRIILYFASPEELDRLYEGLLSD